MSTVPEMDEFVNWDNADLTAGTGMNPQYPAMVAEEDPMRELDLVLENVDGDDFSFWALQHYENSNNLAMPSLDPAIDLAMETAGSSDVFEKTLGPSYETPEAPCAHCQTGGYQCKRIREGKFKGYCTSCVALRCECSLSQVPATECSTNASFPFNPWPVMGDHPDPITYDDMHFGEPRPDAVAPGAPSFPSQPETANTRPIDRSTRKPIEAPAPKSGARFSREAVKILKNWLSTHLKHPYPNEEEKDMLQRQTGLSKTQIANWLSNSRRRSKTFIPARSTSPGVRNWSNPIEIPQRRGTPASFEHMNPLQRWQHSPPENEPASVTAIARAVNASASTLSSGLNSPHSQNLTDDGSNRSLCAVSSASSAPTSFSSGGSFASAYSHASRGSWGSSLNRGRRRRRRKATGKPTDERTSFTAPLKTFQCTFCTETFRTKHDWQRHEKSLHLSLERWVCAPNGPRAMNPENGQMSCVFCGEVNPDDAHIENHNHSACQERTREERTFYRKDHLRQHLKLVHGVKFAGWAMEQWKDTTPEIRSRCGFCGIAIDTWTARVDHLAEHFKAGKTMAEWKGDWGFENPVLEMVENSVPPYLIDHERKSPNPYEATQWPIETARNAYELIKSELLFYMTVYRERNGRAPTDDELQVEACRIIFGSEVISHKSIASTPSWLRDLIHSSPELTVQAQLAPIRSATDSLEEKLKINGKDNIFQDDSMERELQDFVKARRLLGLTAMDNELQIEACNIIGRMEEISPHPSDEVANFLLRLVYRSTTWLADFRQRAVLPRSEDVEDEAKRSKDPNTIDSTIHNYSRLESELAEYVRSQRALGLEPTDADLQRHARIVIYEYDDGWNQTAADNADWLDAFKQRHVNPEVTAASLVDETLIMTCMNNRSCVVPRTAANRNNHSRSSSSLGDSSGGGLGSRSSSGQRASPRASSPVETKGKNVVKVGAYFFQDTNCYRRLARELLRYVNSCMSPNNPNCHVPSDEELQHHARCIIYDSDDPWNQTSADNAEWLRRFKRDAGILTDESLPGLPQCTSWDISQGGSGFAPPYTHPSPNTALVSASLPQDSTMTAIATPTTQDQQPQNQPSPGQLAIKMQYDSRKTFAAEREAANKYLQGFETGLLPPPANVFCSRELEQGLVDFVSREVRNTGVMPSDDAIRARAREILNVSSPSSSTITTPADDAVLLNTFKTMMKNRLGLVFDEAATTGVNNNSLNASSMNMPSTGSSPSGIAMGLLSQQQQQQQQLDIMTGFEFDPSMMDITGINMSNNASTTGMGNSSSSSGGFDQSGGGGAFTDDQMADILHDINFNFDDLDQIDMYGGAGASVW